MMTEEIQAPQPVNLNVKSMSGRVIPILKFRNSSLSIFFKPGIVFTRVFFFRHEEVAERYVTCYILFIVDNFIDNNFYTNEFARIYTVIVKISIPR